LVDSFGNCYPDWIPVISHGSNDWTSTLGGTKRLPGRHLWSVFLYTPGGQRINGEQSLVPAEHLASDAGYTGWISHWNTYNLGLEINLNKQI
jgi:hypothetical protein